MTVKYSKKFPYAPYLNEDIGFEMEVDGDVFTHPDTVMASLATLKATAEMFFYQSNPHLKQENEASIPQEQVEKPTDRIKSIIEDINSCKEIKVLESYKLMAKRNPELQTAYDNKLQALLQP